MWEYTPRMIHAKTIVIDDELSIVGTANFDNRSFRLNFEVVAADLRRRHQRGAGDAFDRDLSGAVRLQPDDGKRVASACAWSRAPRGSPLPLL